ncbi:HAMP domain-containing histidine kinase [Aestuariibacter sp. GS-14]|uniref:sensor histidine kinase n=1 Tax=Aestuariibacter sp. GS-14 TaxID=2590670 RepID=UPI001129D08D|nr:HAMP domain-containing sensor histidine kinase [Aestuariibacter sp. GS-14]TPV55052.1 HAMP domain-containing histidine kinase [Aestuariibacter sp. GS-14]
MDVQSRIVELALSPEVKMGETAHCAKIIADIITDAAGTTAFGMWLGRLDASLQPVYRDTNENCYRDTLLPLSLAPEFAQLVRDQSLTHVGRNSDLPNGEVLQNHLLFKTKGSATLVSDHNADILCLLVCEPGLPNNFDLLPLQKLARVFLHCAIARQNQDYLKLLKDMKQQVVKTEQLAMLGGIVASVTHEINTPLGVAVTGLSHLTDEVNALNDQFISGTLTETSFKDFMASCAEVCTLLDFNIHRAVELVNGFKKTAVDQAAQDTIKFNISERIKGLATSLGPELKRHGIKLRLALPQAAITENVPGALSQIMTNLFFNSVKHAFQGIESPVVSVSSDYDSERSVLKVIYSDNGVGIPKAHQPLIFQQFFTTRRGEDGSGLGMSIAKELAQNKLQGDLYFDPTYTDGARFIIEIPISEYTA